MHTSITSFIVDGLTARPVRVEVDVHRSLPSFAIVGLPEPAVRESWERIHLALVNGGFEFPLQRVVVNIAPASLRWAGPQLDLAIGAGILLASGQIDWARTSPPALVGELDLDGAVCPVAGALAIAEAAAADGVTELVVPYRDGPEAALADGVEILPLASLPFLSGLAAGEEIAPPKALTLPTGPLPDGPDLADLRGRPWLRRALEVAAAGGHDILLIGDPGSGVGLAAARLPSILPPMDEEEALEVVRIAGVTGRLGPGGRRGRPFRAPHDSISSVGLLGGGIPARPGEVTLAHRGVLLLQDVGEFDASTLADLRAALVDGEVTITRGAERRQFPCRLQLVATSEPCPCGSHEEPPVRRCTTLERRRLLRRVVGSLGARLDIVIDVPSPSAAELAGPAGESSAAVRDRVVAARERAEARLGRGRTNSRMDAGEVRETRLSSDATKLLAVHQATRPLSRTTPDRILRVARTVADLDGTGRIGVEEMRTALRLQADSGGLGQA